MIRAPLDLVLRSQEVVTPEGVRPASIHVLSGRIVAVAAFDDIPSGVKVVSEAHAMVMPGVVDTHVHVNEPGRTRWEGFRHATAAAAAGGITTICDMPLNSIPATTTVEALEAKRRTARAHAVAHVDVRYIGGVVPGNVRDLEPLRDAGVCAFKCFLSPSGVAEFSHVGKRDLEEAFPVLARLGLPLMVHAEDPSKLRVAAAGADPIAYATYLATRPVEAEHAAIAMLIGLMERWPVRVHIVHLSSPTSLPMIRVAKAKGLPLTVETCPHYLTFAAEEIPDGATIYKCAPPIRAAAAREGLWRGLVDGDIDLVASDHSPCPPSMKGKKGDFLAAWGGIPSLQHALRAVWTGAQARGVPAAMLSKWMSEAPARLVGLSATKGAIKVGCDADLVVFDSHRSLMVQPYELLSRHALTPYLAHTLAGEVLTTYVGGHVAHGNVL